jgi:hypothetical protein
METNRAGLQIATNSGGRGSQKASPSEYRKLLGSWAVRVELKLSG